MSAQPPPPFSNTPVAPDSLPDIWTLQTSAVSPRYRQLNLTTVAVIFSGLLVIITGFRFQPWFGLTAELQAAYPRACMLLAAVGLVWFVYHFFADLRVRYALREQDLVLHKGLIFKSISCQPILRIQHIELKRGPLERLAGLASLQVFSAGGAGHTFEIPGLPVARAQQLRQFILSHKELDAK
ncbi:PH domain-containing protein [Salinimonas marina]|uniref:PH domain-containing protein n=1 Tax=Salinimonas marina TaxID=2785918 RepID=A0A7S9HDJ6_9ALTE|nr:PH domain-containing protein [Salinimonas marina]QPG06229.1 PH domain-containing protein [Salinimonas marina]